MTIPHTYNLPLRPRRFVSIIRTVSAPGKHILDAIDDDGRAWWLVIGSDVAPKEWTERLPLPSREDHL